MTARRWSALLALLGVLMLTVPAPVTSAAAAEQEPAGPVALLPEGPVVLDGGTAVVLLANRTTNVVSITLRGSLAREDGQGYSDVLLTPVGEKKGAKELRRQLQWGQTLAVTVEGVSGAGALTLESSTGSATPVLRHRELMSTGEVPVLPGESWSGRAGSWSTWFTNQGVAAAVPVQHDTCAKSWVLEDVTLADGDARLSGSARCAGDTVRIDLGEAPRAGTYTGTLVSGTQSSTISLTVSAGWFWAALLATLGTLLAIAQRAWVVNRRPFAVVAEQAQRLPVQARAADDVVARSGGLPQVNGHAAYRLETGVREAMQQLATDADHGRRALGWVRSVLPRPVTEVTDELQVLVADLDLAEQAVRVWPTSADLFDDLAAAARAHGAQAVVQAGPLWAEVVATLNPPAAVAVRPESVRPLLESVEGMTSLLRLLPALAALEAGVAAREQAHYTGLDQQTFQEASQDVRQAHESFATMTWRQLRASGVDVLLDRARTLLAGLPVRSSEPVLTRSLDRPPPTPEVVGDLVLRPGGRWWPRRLLPQIPRATVDLLLLLLVAFAVTWAGVVLLYAGHAWGSWADAVSAVVWGYGAGVLSGPILAGLERLTSRKATLPVEAA